MNSSLSSMLREVFNEMGFTGFEMGLSSGPDYNGYTLTLYRKIPSLNNDEDLRAFFTKLSAEFDNSALLRTLTRTLREDLAKAQEIQEKLDTILSCVTATAPVPSEPRNPQVQE